MDGSETVAISLYKYEQWAVQLSSCQKNIPERAVPFRARFAAMNSLRSLPTSSAPPSPAQRGRSRRPPTLNLASSKSAASPEKTGAEVQDQKSEIYSNDMTKAMGAGLSKNCVTLMWKGDDCSSVEVSGLDIGWGQRIPLKFNEEEGVWILEKNLPEGRYEYKYIVDGKWLCNKDELLTRANSDGHVSSDDASVEATGLRKRLASKDVVDLTEEERRMIRGLLESYQP
ncbi:Dual specificity phosphatase, catalytic domain [Musa troglodytarum]|uniref:Dual specificity phosphatase, catalytic domain n=1 Tax=Musa troglodytarum TaxID=320322 RepID=A0A9E7HKS8_9LILI|nr:Dual specificity phosphatase, catalytic domain [Musa troglodytarum]